MKNLSLLIIAFLILQCSTFAQTEYWDFKGLPGIQIKNIAINADEHLFATSDSKIFFSSDNGEFWEDRTNNLPAGWVRSILIDSVSTISPRVFVIISDSIFVYHIYESLNNGESWELFELPNSASPRWMGINSYGHLYFHPAPSLLKTTDNGLTWITKQISYFGNAVTLSFLDYDILVGTGFWDDIGMRYTNVIKSTNDGDSFFSIGGGNTIHALMTQAPGLNGDIFYWIDHWIDGPYIKRYRIEHPNEIYSNRKFWSVAVNKYDYIFFTNFSQFFYTTDNGSSWVDSLSGIIPGIQALDITKYGYLVAGTESGIYITKKSTMPSHYPSFLTFEELKLGEQVERQLSIINNTTSEVTVDSFCFSSTIFSSPSLTPITLNPFDSTYVNLNFSPEMLGEFTEQVWVHTQDYTDSVSLFGSSPFPELKIFPSINVQMGMQYVGTTITESIQLKNISINTLQIDSLTLFSTQFDFNSSNFPIILEQGEHTPVDIIFSPTVMGLHRDTLIIYSNGIGETEVYLVGSAINPTSNGETENEIPEKFFLYQNYPNPFNPITTIFYGLPHESAVEILIYDVLGNNVMRIARDNHSAGYYSIKFDGSTLSSGIYFCRLQAGSFVQTNKMVLMK